MSLWTPPILFADRIGIFNAYFSCRERQETQQSSCQRLLTVLVFQWKLIWSQMLSSLRTSLPMYSDEPVHKYGRLLPCTRYFLVLTITYHFIFLNLFFLFLNLINLGNVTFLLTAYYPLFFYILWNQYLRKKTFSFFCECSIFKIDFV